MSKKFKIITATFFIMIITQFSFAQTAENLKKASAKGNIVFLVVTDGQTKLNEAKTIAYNSQKKTPKSEVVTLNKADIANKDLITKYGLTGSQLPIILVLAPNGAAAGGYVLAQATPEKLIDIIPTKKQADALLAFMQGKAVFIVASRKNMTDKTAAITECNNSSKTLKGKAIVIDLDLDNKSEAEFIKMLNADTKATKTTVIVFNSSGQNTLKALAPVKSADLTISATKKAGGCCPGGSGKGCGK